MRNALYLCVISIALLLVFSGCTTGQARGAASNTCSDTDGGKVTAVKGTVSGIYSNKPYAKTDSCPGARSVLEFYCSANRHYSQTIKCPSGTSCTAGACLPPCTPTAEVCDNKDNDCDSSVDEDNVCAKPDLIVKDVMTSTAQAGGTYKWVAVRVDNIGTAAVNKALLVEATITENGYLFCKRGNSFNIALEPGQNMAVDLDSLNPQESNFSTCSPFKANASYALKVSVDRENLLQELDESNNEWTQPIIVAPATACTNGVKDPGETGVDCGGACPACQAKPIYPGQNFVVDGYGGGYLCYWKFDRMANSTSTHKIYIKDLNYSSNPASVYDFVPSTGAGNFVCNGRTHEFIVHWVTSVDDSFITVADDLLGTSCIDTDNGAVYTMKGLAVSRTAFGQDMCAILSALYEYRCNASSVAMETYICPNGCYDGMCMPAPSCTDGIRNGVETDIDCGGSCPKCGLGKHCVVTNDCLNSTCNNSICTAGPACTPGYVCLDSMYRAYRNAVNCSFSTMEYCTFGCVNGVCRPESAAVCTDTDGGLNLSRKGTCSDNIMNPQGLTDMCSGTLNQIYEYYCSATEHRCVTQFTTCPTGCNNGACIEFMCEESDGGNNYDVPGNITESQYSSGTRFFYKTMSDSCLDSTRVAEYYCSANNTAVIEVGYCPGNCTNRACS